MTPTASTNTESTTAAEDNIFITLGQLDWAAFRSTCLRKTDAELDRLCRAMHVNPYAADALENLHEACKTLADLWQAGLVSQLPM